jgi:hypothetical protein
MVADVLDRSYSEFTDKYAVEPLYSENTVKHDFNRKYCNDTA